MNDMNSQFLTPKAQRTRKAIIDAARKLVGLEGIEGVTVLSVCKKANVGRTSFYNYFSDTQPLLETLASEVGEELKVRFEAIHGEMDRGLERLQRCIFVLLQKAMSDPELGLLITALARNYPEFSQMLEQQIRIELEAAIANKDVRLSPTEVDIIINYLTVSLLALMRHFAAKPIPVTDVDTYVQCLMQSLVRNSR